MQRMVLGQVIFVAVCCSVLADDVLVLTTFETPPDLHFPSTLESGVNAIFASAGVKMLWAPRDTTLTSVPNEFLVQLEFRGQCGESRLSGRAELPLVRKLGAAAVTDGQVLSMATIDCDAIAALVNTAIDGKRPWFISMMYRRLAARVVAHELLHILLRTTQHDETATRSWQISPSALATETRLTNKEIVALQAPRYEVAVGGQRRH